MFDMLLFFIIALFIDKEYGLFTSNGAFMFFMLTIVMYFYGEVMGKIRNKKEKN